MSRTIKNLSIVSITRTLESKPGLILIDTSKLTGNATNRLRSELRSLGIGVLHAKNSLLTRSLNAVGYSTTGVQLTGASSVLYGASDIVALAKAATAISQKHESMTIKGGACDGRCLSSQEVEVLSKSPGRDEILSNISGMISSVGGRLVSTLKCPTSLSGQIQTISGD